MSTMRWTGCWRWSRRAGRRSTKRILLPVVVSSWRLHGFEHRQVRSPVNPSQKPKVVVLGAGPAGISAAWRLSELGYPVTVLDRNDAVGGMARTITLGEK